MGLYYSVVDPGSVLEMIQTLEAHRSEEEMKAISSLLDELTDYIKRLPNHDKERAELILRARQVRGVVRI